MDSLADAAASGIRHLDGTSSTIEGEGHLAWILDGTPGLDARTPGRLIAEFGSLGAVLDGSRSRQRRASASDAAILRISRFRAAMLHVLRPCAIDRPVLADWMAVNGYLRLDMAFASIERFRVLYLDAANRLLRDVVVSEGTIDRTCVSIRELLREALDLGAASLIVAHNHPSGHPEPSTADRALTAKLSAACSTLDVDLIDHVIVGTRGTFSFRGAGLLP